MASHSDHQRIGQSIGSKLRAARLARKLTQSQIARPDFSVSYVSAIERGQINPSLRALEIFAQRLGISTTDLLAKPTGQAFQEHAHADATSAYLQTIELPFILAHLFILQGNYPQAMALLQRLSADTLKPQQEIQERYLLGVALSRSGLLQESESVLTEAFNKARHQNDYFMKGIQQELGSVHVAMHNQTLGFAYQQESLDQLEKQQQAHDAFFDAQVYTTIGLHYVDMDNIDDAIAMFEQALAQTKELSLPEPLTSMYWNMSSYLAETQQYFLASLYGYKTLQVLTRAYTDALRSEIYHYLGRAMLQQDPHNALAYLESLVQDGTLEKDTLTFASISATTAEALLKLGEVDKAYAYAQRAYKLIHDPGDDVVAASIVLTYGSAAYAHKDYDIGDEQFRAGLTMLERLQNREELAEKYALYAQLLERRGLEQEALNYYRLAYESSLKP